MPWNSTIYRATVNGRQIFYPDGFPQMSSRSLEGLAIQLAEAGEDISAVRLLDADTLEPFAPDPVVPPPPRPHEIERLRQRAEANGEVFDPEAYGLPPEAPAPKPAARAPKPPPEPPATDITAPPRSMSEIEDAARRLAATGISLTFPMIEELAERGEIEPWELEVVRAQAAEDTLKHQPHEIYKKMREGDGSGLDFLESQARKIPDRFRNNPDQYPAARDATMRKVADMMVSRAWLNQNISSDLARRAITAQSRVTGLDSSDDDSFMVTVAPEILGADNGEGASSKIRAAGAASRGADGALAGVRRAVESGARSQSIAT
jgi:hypothetical protein